MWSAALCIGGGLAQADQPAPDLRTGEAAYAQSCARCHGAVGHGDGLDAKRFYPRPRDLTLGVYKFRSTVSGTPPTDADLFVTITNGLPGTNMPDWRHLDEATRWQIVYYLKSLSRIFSDVEPTPVAVAPDPGPARADLARGKADYGRLGCAACHGVAGRANGMSAAGLADDWGMPIRPANLTKGWTYRGGSDPRSILLRVLTGIDGAGMPSYAETIAPEDAWHLAYYVASLQESARWNMIARPLRVNGPLPEDPDDPRWRQAERTDLRMRNVVNADGEWARPPTVQSAALAMIANAEGIAIRLSWDDPTRDAGSPTDALAVILKPPGAQGDVVTLQAWPYGGGPALDLSYWAARDGDTRESLAADFELAGPGRQAVHVLPSRARYDDGRWTLVVQRPLQPSVPPGAAVIAEDGFTALALAVWDGQNPEARAVSPWIDLALSDAHQQRTRH